MTRAEEMVQTLMDLGDYDIYHAWEIYRNRIKPLKSMRQKNTALYIILEKRRADIGLSPIYKEE